MPSDHTGLAFMEKTKYRYLSTSDQEKHLPQPPLELPADPDKPIIDLPQPESIRVSSIDLRKAIEDRHSIRTTQRNP
jgi:hypothetical protein